MKKFLSLILVMCFVVTALVACKKPDPQETEGTYTYNDAVSTLSSNWNPHTYQTSDESYPIGYITSGLYTFIFNDASHPVEGRDPFDGYKIVPEMAAGDPVDVTEAVKALDNNKYNIPADATKGYAYTIKLNENAKWENGTPINADTYIYSMQMLLEPKLLNYRASDYYDGSLCIAGAEYYANQGHSKQLTPNGVMDKEDIATLADYLTKYGSAKAYINWNYSYGEKYDPATKTWAETTEEDDKVVDSGLTVKELYDLHVAKILSWGADQATADAYFADESYVDWTYPENVSFDTVGLYKSGDYEITLVLSKSLAGFNLFYNLTGNWIVYQPYYDENIKKETVDGKEVWTSSYNTSVESTMSYGPYKMTFFQADKSMKFERNTEWFGYSSDTYKYVSPNDGKTYQMYQTDVINCQWVKEASTMKQLFLKGELMTYGLQSDDFEQYRNSDRTYKTPSETIFFLIVNGYEKVIKEREGAADFDKTKYDLETLSLSEFKQALAVTYDKELLASTVSPARSGGYGLIGESYIYDPDTGARYRDTDAAKKALCTFYGVDTTKFETLDAAVASITGYNPTLAKDLFKKAYDAALAAGYVTDADNDGKCDQMIQIEYCASEVSDFIETTVEYLTKKLQEVLVGTPLEGKVEYKVSAPYGNDWSNKIRGGLSDCVLGGWSGSALDPFGLTDLYVNPSRAYNAQWFNANEVTMELEVNTAGIGNAAKMEKITMALKQWSDALNGATVEVNGKSYNFGDGIAEVETRLEILAAFEVQVLQTYDYIPMLQNAGMSMLTKQCYYVVEEYNPIMGRGGIAYLRYNYNDADWAAWVAAQPNQTIEY